MNSSFTSKQHFIGVDISNQTLDVSLLGVDSPDHFLDLRVDNSFKGFDKIHDFLQRHGRRPEDCMLCMEHTGTYGLLFFAWLSQMGWDFCVESGYTVKRSLGMVRGKCDQVDARRLADFAYTHRAKLRPFEMPSMLILQIKQLLTYREQSVRIRTSLKNSLKSHQKYQRLSGLNHISEGICEQIRQQDEIVEGIERQLVEVIGNDPDVKRNYQLATSVRGIGLVIAAFMLVTTNNFSSFENGREYACYAGIAPFENSSGSSFHGKTRISHLGNKTMKTLLTSGARSAITWDKEIRSFYLRKEAEGKEPRSIVNAIRCKLVNRVFAVVKRQTPFVDIYRYNFS